MKNREKVALIDMDDVLCDFQTMACKACGFSRKELEARRVPGTWDITKPLGLSNKEFWKFIRSHGVSFWADLHPTPWYKEILRYVNDRFEHWYIVTSPDADPRCYAGKIVWAQKHLGTYYQKVIPTSHKWLLSAKERVLIDDKFQNLIEFEFDHERKPRGGMGILFPHEGNPLYDRAKDPLDYVKVQIDAFLLQKRKRRVQSLDSLL